MKKSLLPVLAVSLGLVLSGCQLFQSNDNNNRIARCKEIKSRMMFNGTTTNPSQNFEENQDQGLLNKSYHDEDCS